MFTEVILPDAAVLKINWDSIFKENNIFPASERIIICENCKWVYKMHTWVYIVVYKMTQNDLVNYWNNEDVPSQVQFEDIFHHVLFSKYCKSNCDNAFR